MTEIFEGSFRKNTSTMGELNQLEALQMLHNMTNFLDSNIQPLKAMGVVSLGVMVAAGGWVGVLFGILGASMALDLGSGFAKAMKAGTWASKKAREGLLHKGGMLFVVCVAAGADFLVALTADVAPQINYQHNFIVLPIVLIWYIATEMGSVLENCVALDAPVPGFLKRLIKSIGNAAEKAGDEVAKQIDKQASDETQPK